MHDEAVGVFAAQSVNDLLIALCAQSGCGQGLGFTAGKQRRTVGAWQHAGLDVDRAYGTGIATVNARLTIQDLTTNHFAFQVFEQGANFVHFQSAGFFGNQSRFKCCPSFAQFHRAFLF